MQLSLYTALSLSDSTLSISASFTKSVIFSLMKTRTTTKTMGTAVCRGDGDEGCRTRNSRMENELSTADRPQLLKELHTIWHRSC